MITPSSLHYKMTHGDNPTYASFFWQSYGHLIRSQINWCAIITGIDALNNVYSGVPIWSSLSNHSPGGYNYSSSMMYYTNLPVLQNRGGNNRQLVVKEEVRKGEKFHLCTSAPGSPGKNKALITGWRVLPLCSRLPGSALPLLYSRPLSRSLSLSIIHTHLMVYLACLILMYKHFHVLQLIFQDMSAGSGVSIRP